MNLGDLKKFIEAVQQKEAVMLLRFPEQKKMYAYKGKCSNTYEPTVESVVFAPFDKNENRHFLIPEHTEVFDELTIDARPKHIAIVEDFDEYNTRFKGFMHAIQQENFNKLVLSRCISVSEVIAVLESFITACNTYPDACCYLWYSAETGSWLGATPEVLVEQTQQQLSTYALAATKSAEDQSAWTTKEKEEQAFVTQYILEILKNKGLSPKASKPVETKAGKIKHLKTVISVHVPAHNHALTIAEDLHPTPAVAGLPKDEAVAFIAQNEGYSRRYYTGYFGLLKPKTVRLFVNLRCLQVKDGKSNIYVGGGLTKASNVNDEWTETQRKAKTMLEILQLKED